MTKIKSTSKYPLAPLKMTMHSEWDVLYAFYEELKWFPHRPTFEFFPSHQDDDDHTSLSLPAQLNVDIDELALKGLEQLAPKFYLPLDPIAKVQLNHDGCSITWDYKNKLREIPHLPSLRRFYMQYFNWSGTIFNYVD